MSLPKKHRYSQVTWLVSICAFTVLALLVLYPTCSVLICSFTNGGDWTVENYAHLFSSSRFYKLLFQSLTVSLASATTSTALGMILAILIVKTKSPWRKTAAIVAVVPIILPGFVTSIAYIFLFGRNGLISYKLLHITWDVYSWKSVFILQCVDQTTTAFLMISAALASIGKKPEEAAKTLGAKDWLILREITLKLSRPMILAAFLLNFMRAMGDFGTPLIVGGSFDTLASASYTQLIGRYDISMAAAYNVILLVITLLSFFWYMRLEDKKDSSLSWRSGQVASLSLTGWPAFVLKLIAGIFLLFIVTLAVAVLMAAFTKRAGSSTVFTLEYFRNIHGRGWSSTFNTIIFSFCVGCVASFFGQVLAYLIRRIKLPGSRFLDTIATIPFALPGTFIGVGYAIAFNTPPLLLTGTWFIVVMNLVVRKLPLGIRTGVALLEKQDYSLDEAAKVLGHSSFSTFFSVTLPQLRSSLFICALYGFITTIQALGSIIFIITPGTKLLSVDVFEAVIRGDLGVAAAYSFVMLIIGGIGGAFFFVVLSRKRQPINQIT